jgi:[ribosomal protein S18]-alanine N-acetyltransferase
MARRYEFEFSLLAFKIPMHVRSAELGDVPRMMELEREAQTAAHWTEQNYRSIFTETSPRRLALVVERVSLPEYLPELEHPEQRKLCGFIVARCVDTEWEIENLVVAVAERRQGCGSRLVQELLKRARSEGACSVELEVRCTNLSAKRLYGQCGFEERGTRKSYYSNPLEDALLLRLDFPAAASENG